MPPASGEDERMRLLRLGDRGSEIPAVRHDGAIFDLRPLTADIDGSFFADDGIGRAAEALAAGALDPLEHAATLRVGPPIARPPAIVCIGQNYAAHAAESGSPPPDRPIVFFKHPNTLCGPNDDIVKPAAATQLDWEVELAVVVGRTAYLLGDADDPLAHVAGYSIANDLSEREWQRFHGGPQWSKGKSLPGSCPLGPELVTPDELGDVHRLRLRSWVNGEPRQDSTTADMIFDVAALVRDLSQYMTLEPGDLIITGTPQGVALSGNFPYLAVGDVFSAAIDGLGELRQTVVAG